MNKGKKGGVNKGKGSEVNKGKGEGLSHWYLQHVFVTAKVR